MTGERRSAVQLTKHTKSSWPKTHDSGGLAAVTSLGSILVCLYLAISPGAYTSLAHTARDWLRQQQGDKEVTSQYNNTNLTSIPFI